MAGGCAGDPPLTLPQTFVRTILRAFCEMLECTNLDYFGPNSNLNLRQIAWADLSRSAGGWRRDLDCYRKPRIMWRRDTLAYLIDDVEPSLSDILIR